MLFSKTDRGKRRLDGAGPAPADLRKIPFFEMPQASGPGPAVEVEATSAEDRNNTRT